MFHEYFLISYFFIYFCREFINGLALLTEIVSELLELLHIVFIYSGLCTSQRFLHVALKFKNYEHSLTKESGCQPNSGVLFFK